MEPGDRVKQHEEQGHGVKSQKRRRLQSCQESSVRLGTLGEGSQLPQIEHREKRHEHARHLTQDKLRVGGVLQPPPYRHAAAVPPGMVRSVMARRVAHLVPQGSRRDLKASTAPASLYCWM